MNRHDTMFDNESLSCKDAVSPPVLKSGSGNRFPQHPRRSASCSSAPIRTDCRPGGLVYLTYSNRCTHLPMYPLYSKWAPSLVSQEPISLVSTHVNDCRTMPSRNSFWAGCGCIPAMRVQQCSSGPKLEQVCYPNSLFLARFKGIPPY